MSPVILTRVSPFRVDALSRRRMFPNSPKGCTGQQGRQVESTLGQQMTSYVSDPAERQSRANLASSGKTLRHLHSARAKSCRGLVEVRFLVGLMDGADYGEAPSTAELAVLSAAHFSGPPLGRSFSGNRKTLSTRRRAVSGVRPLQLSTPQGGY